MREILFRAKAVVTGEWVYGYTERKVDAVENAWFMRWFMHCPVQNPDDVYREYEISPETLGEFTGLTDKNGKKIFEGDIVKSPDYNDGPHIGTVYIGKYTTTSGVNIYGCHIQWQPPEDVYVRPDLYYWTDEDGIEIIGNIYDNPELLEVKDNEE